MGYKYSRVSVMGYIRIDCRDKFIRILIAFTTGHACLKYIKVEV